MQTITQPDGLSEFDLDIRALAVAAGFGPPLTHELSCQSGICRCR